MDEVVLAVAAAT